MVFISVFTHSLHKNQHFWGSLGSPILPRAVCGPVPAATEKVWENQTFPSPALPQTSLLQAVNQSFQSLPGSAQTFRATRVKNKPLQTSFISSFSLSIAGGGFSPPGTAHGSIPAAVENRDKSTSWGGRTTKSVPAARWGSQTPLQEGRKVFLSVLILDPRIILRLVRLGWLCGLKSSQKPGFGGNP